VSCENGGRIVGVPVVIPVIVVAVDVHLALLIPLVERGVLCKISSLSLPIDPSTSLRVIPSLSRDEYSPGCILFGIFKSANILHQVSFVFRK
jgi:hypothetical protein